MTSPSTPTAPPSEPGGRAPGPSPETTFTPPPEPPSRPYAAALLLIGAGVIWALVLVGVPIRWELVLPAALIVVGAVLLLTRRASTGGLVALGIVVLVASLVVVPLSTNAGADIGQRQEVITTVDELGEGAELGIGSLLLDLRGIELEDEVVQISASVGIGELRVRVPEGVRVTGEARAGIGAVRGPSGDSGGFGVSTDLQGAIGDVQQPDAGSPALTLDLEVGIGQVVVTR